MDAITPLDEIKVADSHFLGFCFPVASTEEVDECRNKLKKLHPDAAHIPLIWWFGDDTGNAKWDEDGEPPESIGPGMVQEVESFFANKDAIKKGLLVGIVRYFGNRLFGVTCGRLGGCYRSILRKALHRHFFPGVPLVIDLTNQPEKELYGMGAGDCELILNLVEDNMPLATANKDDAATEESTPPSLVNRLLSELQFDCFKGAAGEELPRLQNLQADISDGIFPVYRYPGNYSGDLWTTFEWSPTSLQVKNAVEERLKPLVDQVMNHCVTNYYRDGKDFIAHHGDKDLDLNRQGVIVSVSLGETRVLELRRRAEPKDIFRMILPHRSMFVLGPHTNREWTHSILTKEESEGIRLSLTMRDVKTFRDSATGRLFGPGVDTQTLDEIRQRAFVENAACFAAFCGLTASMSSKKAMTARNMVVTGACVLGIFGLRLLSSSMRKKQEERSARDFFSKHSSSGTKY